MNLPSIKKLGGASIASHNQSTNSAYCLKPPQLNSNASAKLGFAYTNTPTHGGGVHDKAGAYTNASGIAGIAGSISTNTASIATN